MLKANANAELAAEQVEQRACGIRKRHAAGSLQANQQIIHAVAAADDDFVFDDLRQAANQVVNGARIKIDAAHDHHIVGAAKHAAAYAREATPARASLCHHLHEIAGAVTNRRHAAATEIRDHQFAALALTHRSAARRVNHFKDELSFVQVNRAALRLAVEGPRADLRSARMIE